MSVNVCLCVCVNLTKESVLIWISFPLPMIRIVGKLLWNAFFQFLFPPVTIIQNETQKNWTIHLIYVYQITLWRLSSSCNNVNFDFLCVSSSSSSLLSLKRKDRKLSLAFELCRFECKRHLNRLRNFLAFYSNIFFLSTLSMMIISVPIRWIFFVFVTLTATDGCMMSLVFNQVLWSSRQRST